MIAVIWAEIRELLEKYWRFTAKFPPGTVEEKSEEVFLYENETMGNI